MINIYFKNDNKKIISILSSGKDEYGDFIYKLEPREKLLLLRKEYKEKGTMITTFMIPIDNIDFIDLGNDSISLIHT